MWPWVTSIQGLWPLFPMLKVNHICSIFQTCVRNVSWLTSSSSGCTSPRTSTTTSTRHSPHSRPAPPHVSLLVPTSIWEPSSMLLRTVERFSFIMNLGDGQRQDAFMSWTLHAPKGSWWEQIFVRMRFIVVYNFTDLFSPWTAAQYHKLLQGDPSEW